MRFSTKILLLTLATTLGLSGIVVLVVRSEITARETLRAQREISTKADAYFERLDTIQDSLSRTVTREMGDPNNRALLDSFQPQATAEDRNNAEGQFALLFTEVLQQELDHPALHALVDSRGHTLVSAAIGNEALAALLKQPQTVTWRVGNVLRDAKPARQYLWLDGRLYLVFAVPLRQTTDEPPSYVYLAGFEVTDEWVRRLLDRNPEEVTVTAWFVVDGKIVARGSELEVDAARRHERIDKLLALVSPAAQPTGTRHPVFFEVAGEPFVGQYTVFEPAIGVKGVLALASSLEEALAPLRNLQRRIAIVTCVVAALALIAARWISRRLAKPIEMLVEGTHRIAKGDFTHSIELHRSDEIGELASSFNEMAIGLAQRDLIKDTLGQFVDPRIADALLTNPASLRGQRAEQSVLFSDLEKFTSISEKLAPEALVKMLNRFLGASADVVKELNGYLDKFTGDGVIAFWGPPVEMNHSIAACRAALRMIDFTSQFHDPPLRVRVGIATGEVLVGIVGSESSKKNYTAMGDVVNLASRLEGANKVYGTQILVDARTASEVSGSIVTRKIDTVRVIGRGEPVELFEVLGEAGAVDGVARIDQFARAMSLYTSRRWPEAREQFSAIDDGPSHVLSLRCERFIQSDPGEWDGVWNLDAK